MEKDPVPGAAWPRHSNAFSAVSRINLQLCFECPEGPARAHIFFFMRGNVNPAFFPCNLQTLLLKLPQSQVHCH